MSRGAVGRKKNPTEVTYMVHLSQQKKEDENGGAEEKKKEATYLPTYLF
jgi:hypothetical protein